MKTLFTIVGVVVALNSLFAGPLQDAYDKGDLDLIKTLVEAGISIDHIGEDASQTVLTDAVSDNNIDAVDLFLSLGADFNYVVGEGDTPFSIAIYQGRNEIAKKFINAANSIKKVEGARHSLLFEACKNINKNRNIIELLLNKGADINERDEFGRTALHALVGGVDDWKNIPIINDFINRGADINPVASKMDRRLSGKNITFATPLDISWTRQVEQLLIANGAKTAPLVIEERLKQLEQKVTNVHTDNTNPTDQWPRKVWEIDLDISFSSITDKIVIYSETSIIFEAQKSNGNKQVVWVESSNNHIVTECESAKKIIYLDNSNLVWVNSTWDGNRYKSIAHKISKSRTGLKKSTFEMKGNWTKKDIEEDAYYPNYQTVQISWEGTKVTAWDFTPPALATTDNEGENNGGNTAMSRLLIKSTGLDIAIATDGKFGGPAELQKSNDLKNWRKLSNVSGDADGVRITPSKSGNEFFRLKRVGE